MKKNKKDLDEKLKICVALTGTLLFAISAVLIGVYRFRNPQLTETEIMIYSLKNYWWAYICFIISSLCLQS